MIKKKNLLVCIFILCFLVLSGCVEIFDDGGIEYEANPTKIIYKIRYGYFINITGSGNYEIKYDCDIPEVLTSGTVSYKIINESYGHEIEEIVNNNMTRWNIEGKDSNNYVLGIEANVTAQSFIVRDLNGENALTIGQIKTNYPQLVEQYCKPQADDNTVYIDPDNPAIRNIAETILLESNTNNSFIVAKNLFAWLKDNTRYTPHSGSYDLQTAYKTCNDKTGDCDDLSVLYISLCGALDIPARFIRGILINYDESQEKISAEFHEWVEVFVGAGNLIGIKGWIPVECAGTADDENKIQTEIHQNFGVESVGHLRLFEGDGSNESLNISRSGIGYTSYSSYIQIRPESFLEIPNYEIIEENKLYIDKDGYRTYK